MIFKSKKGDYIDNNFIIFNNFFDSSSGAIMETIYSKQKQLNSIVEQLPTKVDRIKPLIGLIVTMIAPAKIYMLKHPDIGIKGEEKYIDLLLVLPPNNCKPFKVVKQILDMAYLDIWQVSCSLCGEGQIIDGLRKGHVFYSLQCIEDNLIYDDKVTVYPVTPPEIVQKMKKCAYLKFHQNFANALDFLEAAAYLQENYTSRNIGFMLHQAVKHTFKGILQGLYGYGKKSHDIRVLKKYAIRCAPQLSNIFSDDSEEEKRILNLLQDAYANFRYENDFEISEDDLNMLFEKIILLQGTAQKIARCVIIPDEL